MSKRRDIVMSAYKLINKDEELLRLLYYPPLSDPLNEKHEDITSKSEKELWKIIDRHVLLTSKSSDLETDKICRVYIYGGKTRPSTRNMLTSRQEIVVDIFCHVDFERDLRMEMITDRLSTLLFNNRLDKGFGKVTYFSGYDFKAPRDYVAYRHIFQVGGAL